MKAESGSPCVGPDRRDLFTLVLAVVIGISLGPMVFGKFFPRPYDYFFVGSGKPLAEHVEPAVDVNRENLIESGVSDEAVKEYDERKADADELQQQATADQPAASEKSVEDRRALRTRFFTLLMHGLMLATAAVMIFEVLTGWFTGLRGRVFRVRLIQSRYLLMSGWLILFFAQPTMYLDISPWFVILLLAVILASGIFALLRSGKATAEMKVTM